MKLLRMIILTVAAIIEVTAMSSKVGEDEEETAIVSCPAFVYYRINSRECVSVDSTKNTLLVGDSRTVGLHNATQNDDISYVAKVSEGYNWLVDGTSDYNTSELIETYLECNPTATVVFNLGVNDLYQKGNYCYYIEELVNNHPESTICYLSVNPTSKSYNDLNSQIDDFNRYLMNNLPESVVWIDSNSYLNQQGFTARDGLHYDSITYKKILEFVLESL